jgi:D-arabinose 1-dehydrogenase-like Zn-dependent alcohol dehydrogenase
MMSALVKTTDGVKCMVHNLPAPHRADDVRIKVLRAAICRTDVFVARGSIPVADGRVLGHEFTGVVDAIGDAVLKLKPGMRVVVNPLLTCGRCADCLSDLPHHCVDTRFLGLHADGAFAQYVVVPAAQVFPLAETIGDALGAYAEPLAATMAVLDADLPQIGMIAVTGAGRIADLTEFILRDHGYAVTRAQATDGYDAVFAGVVETDLCTANAQAILRMLRPGGLLVLKSRMPESVALPPLLCISRRLRVQAVYYVAFDRALTYLERCADWLKQFIGSEWALEDHGKAFAAACSDEALKIYFKPNG